MFQTRLPIVVDSHIRNSVRVFLIKGSSMMPIILETYYNMISTNNLTLTVCPIKEGTTKCVGNSCAAFMYSIHDRREGVCGIVYKNHAVLKGKMVP